MTESYNDIIKDLEIYKKSLICLYNSFQPQEHNNIIHILSKEGLTNVIKFLIKNCCVNVLSQDDIKMTPIHYAARYGQFETLQYLISQLTNKDNIDTYDLIGRTPLHLAIMNNKDNCLNIIDLLISSGANMYLKTNSNKTILCLACEYGRLDIVKHLIEFYKYEIITYDNMKSPLEYAVEYSNYEIAKYLISNTNINPIISKDIARYALFYTINKNDIDNLKFLINVLNIDHKIKNYNNQSAIYVAAKKGFLNIVDYLYNLNKD